MNGTTAYALSKAYVEATLQGAGALKGQDGKDGADGKGAYELAVEKGFEGSDDEWLESLKGADGKDGVDGENGKDGKDGLDGEQNVIESISVNGTPLEPDEDKNVDITIPTSDYTAGTGIQISEDKVISTKDVKKNYIDNSNFRINQTGASEYSTANEYTVDRWYIDGGILTPVENGVQFVNPNTETGASNLVRLRQNIHYGFAEFTGKTVTLSAKINGVVYSGKATIPTEKPTEGTATQYITAGITDFSINLNYSVTADYFVPYIALAYNRTALIEWMKLEVNDEFSGYIEPDYMTELIKMNFTTSDKGALDIPTGGSSDAETVNGHTVESDVPADAVFTDTVYDDTEIRTELESKANKDNIKIYTREYLPEFKPLGTSGGDNYYYSKFIRCNDTIIGFNYIDSYFYIAFSNIGVVKIYEEELFNLESNDVFNINNDNFEKVLLFSNLHIVSGGSINRVITRKNDFDQIEFFIAYSQAPLVVYNLDKQIELSVELGSFGTYYVTDIFKSANNDIFVYNQNMNILGKLVSSNENYRVGVSVALTSAIIDWSTDRCGIADNMTVFVTNEDIIYDVPNYAELESWKEWFEANMGTAGTLLGGTDIITDIECWDGGVFYITTDGGIYANFYDKQEMAWGMSWGEQGLNNLGYLDNMADCTYVYDHDFLHQIYNAYLKVIDSSVQDFNASDTYLLQNNINTNYVRKDSCLWTNGYFVCAERDNIHILTYKYTEADMSETVLELVDKVKDLESTVKYLQDNMDYILQRI